ncbi:MAG: hypothetical protein KKH98_02860 [Spirochaetes bacterium]|nr:hypothetical protein [Spirochaetota bacterium]
MKIKRLFSTSLLISVLLTGIFSKVLKANLFLDIFPVPIPKSEQILSFDTAVRDNDLGFVLQTKNRLLFLQSNDQGSSFQKQIPLMNGPVLGYSLAMDQKYAAIVWIEEKEKVIKYALIRIKNNKLESVKTLYSYKGETAYSPKIIFDDNKLLMIFIDHYNNSSIVKLLKINLNGSIIHNLTPYDKGHSFLPQIAVCKRRYLLVWNNITGSREEIMYKSSSSGGRSWSTMKQIFKNDFKDRNPLLFQDNDDFYLLWQDDHLGNWNVSFSKYTDKEWTDFSRLTSGLVNCWLPQGGFYKGRLFITWLDKSEGESGLFYRKKEIHKGSWSIKSPVNPGIKNIQAYKIVSSEKLIFLTYLKDEKLYFSKLISEQKKFPVSINKIDHDGYKIEFQADQRDISSFAINFNRKKSFLPVIPVLSKEEKTFYVYSKNGSLFDQINLAVRSVDDLGILSQTYSSPLLHSGKNKKYKHISWRKIDENKLYFNFMENRLFLKLKYDTVMKKNNILNKLYFYSVNLNYEEDNDDPAKNKFLRLFDLLNGSIDFNRLIEGDEIFLPTLWENTQFISIIENNIGSTIQQMETRYQLSDKPYLYYFVSKDLQKIKKFDQAEKDDFLIILCPY